MKKLFFPLILGASLARAELVINEVDADQTGNDSGEFVELYDGGVGDTSLIGYVLVFFNGAGDRSYLTLDLTGHRTNAQGFFVVGNPAVPNAAKLVEPGASGAFQNGPDAVALYKAPAANFPNGSVITRENLIDALVYGTNDPDDIELLPALTPGEPQANDPVDQSMARIPDGGAPFKSSLFQNRPPTPGSANQPNRELSVRLSKSSVAENAGKGALVVTIGLSTAPAKALVVTLKVDDPTELAVPATVEVTPGKAEVIVPLDAVDDGWPDGGQKVLLSVEAPDYKPTQAEIQVTDDGDKPGLVVNEVYADDREDANQDGEKGNGKDEFVELVNVSGAPIDLTGHTLRDAVAVRHTFADGLKLEPGCAVVVFGGGSFVEGRSETFAGALALKANGANEFGLGLNNTGDFVRVLNADGLEVAGDRFGAVDGRDGSRTREPDLTGPFVFHGEVGAAKFSPGARIDGSPICLPKDKLTLKITPASIVENAGPAAAKLTVERSGATGKALTVALANSDPSEIRLPASVQIAAGEKSAVVDVEAVNDKAQDGSQNPMITASAEGFLDGQITVEVKDDGDPPVLVLINEVDADQPGDETGEFVELYDGGAGGSPLDGLILVLFNGANGQSYQTIDLNGQSTNQAGFFVVGDAAVPNVDLAIPNFTLQNGPDGVAIFRATKDAFPSATPVTADGLVDAVVYGTGDAPAAGLIDVLTPAEAQVNEGATDNQNSFARVPDGGAARKTSTFKAGKPTPGVSNAGAPEFTYKVWAAGFANLGEPDDDPDGDGLRNAFEYAWKLNPMARDSHGWETLTGLAEGKLFLQFRAPKDPAKYADIAVTKSTNMKTWTPVTQKEVVREVLPHADGGETIRLLVPRSEGPTLFLRLSVLLTAPLPPLDKPQPIAQ